MGRQVHRVDPILIKGLENQIVLNIQVGSDLAVGSPVVCEKVSGIDDQRWDIFEPLFECIGIADTPCQPPDPGRLSATWFQSAMYVAGEMQNEGCAVVAPESIIERRILPDDLETASVFLLGEARSNSVARQKSVSQPDDCQEDEFDSLELPSTLHRVQL